MDTLCYYSCVLTDLGTYMEQYDTAEYAQHFAGSTDTLSTGGSRRYFAAKSEDSLFGTLALVPLQMFGLAPESFQGARGVD